MRRLIFSDAISIRERGASFIEYMLLVSLLAVVIMVSITFVGGDVSNFFDDFGSCLETPDATCTEDEVPFEYPDDDSDDQSN